MQVIYDKHLLSIFTSLEKSAVICTAAVITVIGRISALSLFKMFP